MNDLWSLNLINWPPIQYLFIAGNLALIIKIIMNTIKGRVPYI